MAKRRTPPEGAGNDEPRNQLTIREERFVEAYIENGGVNASQAAVEAGWSRRSAGEIGHRLLKRVDIQEAIELERERLRQVMRFDREKALKILIGMATCRQSDFTAVLANPAERENYVGLGIKEYGLNYVRSSSRTGNEVQIITAAERRAVINELWDKLGLGQNADAKSWSDGLDNLLSIVERIEKRRSAQ